MQMQLGMAYEQSWFGSATFRAEFGLNHLGMADGLAVFQAEIGLEPNQAQLEHNI